MASTRNVRRLALFCAALALMLAAGFVRPAEARYAALVLDVESGTVLYSRNADDRNYPASLTKIMTLYLLFEQLEKGKMTLDTRLPVSRRAAGQAPSKLGLKPGSTIRVEDAILALVTKSANDVATVVGEAIGGTEYKFALMMTEQARELGMRDTTFRNASGLPNRAQLSTARDMATLAIAIMEDFPQYYDYFSTPRFKYGKRTYRNHNNLLGRYEGTDGIKTGYIRASGFNLVASVERDGRRLIGVVFGGRTAASRDAHMVSILDKSFVRIDEMTTPPIPVAQKPQPPERLLQVASAAAPPLPEPDQQPELILAANGPLPDPAIADTASAPPLELASEGDVSLVAESRPAIEWQTLPAPDAGPAITAAPRPAEEQAGQAQAGPAQPAARASGGKNLERLTASKAPPPAAEPAKAPVAAQVAVTTGAWSAQVGAFKTYRSARKRLQRAAGMLPVRFKYRGTAIEPTDESGTRLFRARIIGLSEDGAKRACTLLKRERIGCIAIPPQQLAASPVASRG